MARRGCRGARAVDCAAQAKDENDTDCRFMTARRERGAGVRIHLISRLLGRGFGLFLISFDIHFGSDIVVGRVRGV